MILFMLYITALTLISFFLLDHKLAGLFILVPHLNTSCKVLGLAFQPFIQLAFFSIASLISTSNELFRRLVCDSALVILFVTTLKVLIARARPNTLLLGASSFKFASLDFNYHSMPSAHTCMAFAFCMTISSVYPKLFLPLLTLSILVAISRMLLGAHFLSDCLFGALLGIFVSQSGAKILTLILALKKG
jgi:membrane-associated phospholipid phosphatase